MASSRTSSSRGERQPLERFNVDLVGGSNNHGSVPKALYRQDPADRGSNRRGKNGGSRGRGQPADRELSAGPWGGPLLTARDGGPPCQKVEERPCSQGSVHGRSPCSARQGN